MANNITVTQGLGTTLKTTDTGGVHTPHHNIEIAGVTPTTGAGNADAGTQRVVLASNQAAVAVTIGAAVAVTGTFWQATQPVSAASLPLPTGAATEAGLVTLAGHLDGVETLLGGTLTVGLPAGAATAAKQPALGTAGSASADVITVQGVASMTPVMVGGTVADNDAAAGNPVPMGGIALSTIATYSANDRSQLTTDLRGNLRVLPTLGALAGADGVSNASLGWAQGTTSGSSTLAFAVFPHTFNGASWDRTRKPSAASRIPSAAASTNATVAKASAGDLHIISGNNASGAIRYLKFYDTASSPTVGTTTIELTLTLPTGAFSFDMNGHYFGTGIAYAMTTGAADADTGALSAGDVLGLSITYA